MPPSACPAYAATIAGDTPTESVEGPWRRAVKRDPEIPVSKDMTATGVQPPRSMDMLRGARYLGLEHRFRVN